MLRSKLLTDRDRRRCVDPLIASVVAITASWLGGFAAPATAQFGALAPIAPAASATAVTLPEPVYWKQTLFQIPYQWGTAADPEAATAVWLLVSKDRGATWHNISEAKPHVRSFNYRAEAEGEFWFAVRTIDRQGRAWPAGAYQPELRVIVDTTMPRIDDLQANARQDGAVDIQWRGSDANLDATSWKIEAQTDPFGNWQSVPFAPVASVTPADWNSAAVQPTSIPMSAGHTIWQLPAGRPPVAIRATVLDRAGNSATFQTVIKPVPANGVTFQRLPNPGLGGAAQVDGQDNTGLSNPFTGTTTSTAPLADPAAPPPAVQRDWVPSSDAALNQSTSTQSADQVWPAGEMLQTPYRLWSGGAATNDDGVTAYGNPSRVAAPLAGDSQNSAVDQERTAARYAMNGPPQSVAASTEPPASDHAFVPLEPFRQASITNLPATGPEPISTADAFPPSVATGVSGGTPVVDAASALLPPGVEPKLVGSRTFALEYDIEQIGRWGVSQVELWGTRDGGRTWRSYGRDDDGRSPLVATVDDEGLYGFRIVVESAGATPAASPSAGDAPELWVSVDLQRPIAELTAIEPGAGNLVDHLVLQWRADDNNLEVRPISLFFSSRPTGPWSAIATNLENTGHYAWRVERHVPTRFYLRLEARDVAGNLAAFQTRDPVEFATALPTGRLRAAEPIDPTATGTSTSYR